jgi:hypothetical protein
MKVSILGAILQVGTKICAPVMGQIFHTVAIFDADFQLETTFE